MSATQYEGFAAYHLQLGEHNIVSLGASVASIQRSVNFSTLYFDAQWDGSDFNPLMASNEKNTMSKTSYIDIGAGLNFATFPSEQLYIKLGGSVAHINQPRESFLSQSNLVGMRITGTIDVLAKPATGIVLNPSLYYTTQKSAFEVMYGMLCTLNVGGTQSPHNVIVGAHHRWNDAVVVACGYEWDGLRIISSYDYTISQLGQYIHHNGAYELGLRWIGKYKEKGESLRQYSCPRF